METATDSGKLAFSRFAAPLAGAAARSKIDGDRAAEFVTGHEVSSYEMLIVYTTYTIEQETAHKGNFASSGALIGESKATVIRHPQNDASSP